jgi:hypothetical protein
MSDLTLTPRVTSIRFYSGPVRRQPRVGDRRTTKKHGLQIRVFKMVKSPWGETLGYDCTGGRQRYEWKAPAELGLSDRHLLTAEERKALES